MVINFRIPSRETWILLVVYSFIFQFSGCASVAFPGDKYFDQDYLFFDGKVQLQGRSTLPDARFEEEGMPVRFLDLKKRREMCLEAAVMNGHSKWLALTSEIEKDQSDWIITLQKAGKPAQLKRCLNTIKIRERFFDTINSCRVVLIYNCHPVKY